MKIIDIITGDRPSLSFEVFPPKTSDKFDGVLQATTEIAKLSPSYMSVTYGAGGGTSKYTADICQALGRQGVTPLAHLTCLSSSKERSGVSLAALKKALAAAGYDVEKNNSRIKLGLKSLVGKGTLVQTKGTGASGSFKLNKKVASVDAKPTATKVATKTKVTSASKKPKKASGAAAAKKSVKTPKKARKSVLTKKSSKSPKKPKAVKPKKVAKSPAKAKAVKPKGAKVKVTKPKTAAKPKKAAPKKK